jgi:hypothetical protein
MAYQTKFNGNTDSTISLTKDTAPGVLVEGYFLGTKETPDTGYGPGKIHVFKTQNGDVGLWGKTRLNNQLTPDLIGQMVMVEFTGMVAPAKKGKNPAYGFQVQHDPENTIEVSSTALSAPAEAEEDYEESEAEVEATPPARATRPATALKTPDAAARAKVMATLSGRKVG